MQRSLAGGTPVVIDGQTLDASLQFVLAWRARTKRPGLVAGAPAAARDALRRDTAVGRPASLPAVVVRDLVIDGAAGPLAARHYAPGGAAAQGAPILVYLHGGGFVVGDLETHDAPCRELCAQAAMHVLSVDYRLAPEHPFPAAIDDTIAAVRWTARHGATLGGDPDRICLGGDSAGANLAVVATMIERDLPVVAQLLLYPPTDAVTVRPSHALFDTGFFLSHDDREAFTRHYLDGTGVSRDDPRVSPLFGDLTDLPPAVVVTAGFDILRDESDALAVALKAAGTPVLHLREKALPHGFANMIGVSETARRAIGRLAREWRRTVLAQPSRARETHT
jgi:acetyl esterase